MDGLLDQVGSVIGDVLNSVPVRLLVLGTIAYATVVWLATAQWVLRDMRRRRDDPVSPYLGALAIILATPILLPISTFTYLVLRPRETLAEMRERELTERLEAMGAEAALACPGCRRPVEDDWLTCPACRTRLARRCGSCGRSMGLDWSLCGFCGAEFGRPVVAKRVPVAVRGGGHEHRGVSLALPEPDPAERVTGARQGERPRPRPEQARPEPLMSERDRPKLGSEPRREVLEPGT